VLWSPSDNGGLLLWSVMRVVLVQIDCWDLR